MMDLREDAQAAIDALQRRRLQNRIAQKNRRKRLAGLEQTRLREVENQARESQHRKGRTEDSLHTLNPTNDAGKLSASLESFTSCHNVQALPSIEPMEPSEQGSSSHDMVSAAGKLTWDPEDYLTATTVCDTDVTNTHNNLSQATQGSIRDLNFGSPPIGSTVMQATTRCSFSSPSKARRDSNTDGENGPPSQAFYTTRVDGKCYHQEPITGHTQKDNSSPQRLPECHGNRTDPTPPPTPESTLEKLQHRMSGDLQIFSDSYGFYNKGKTALHISAERGNGGIVRLLIFHGVDVNGTDSWGRTALHYACGVSCVDVVAQLLKGGADPDICDHNGRSPLHAAVDAGCDAVVRLLAQEGADLNAAIGVGGGESVSDSFDLIEP